MFSKHDAVVEKHLAATSCSELPDNTNTKSSDTAILSCDILLN